MALLTKVAAKKTAGVPATLADPQVDLLAFERDKIKGAIRTGFILWAEIIAIALGTVAGMAAMFLVGGGIPTHGLHALAGPMPWGVAVMPVGSFRGARRRPTIGRWRT